MLTRFRKNPPIFNFSLVLALQSFFMGLYLALEPDKFSATLYHPLFNIAPKIVFAFYLMFTGIILLHSSMKNSMKLARIGFVLFGTYYVMELSAYLVGVGQGNVTFWPVIKDLSMFAMCGVGAFSFFPYTERK